MLVSEDIDNILHSDKSTFLVILDKIVLENITSAKKELDELDTFNKVLYETVEFTLQKLNEEEGILSRLFYRSFGIGKKNNKRREQLHMLGANLKGHISQLERDRKRINFYQDNLSSSYGGLKSLSDGFAKKLMFLSTSELEARCNQYLKIVYEKMDETDSYKKSLDMKDIYLESCISNYEKLLKRIPRNKEIKNENYLEYKL